MQNLSQVGVKVRQNEKGARVAVQVTAKVLDNPFEGWTTIQEAADIIGRRKTTVASWANKGWVSCFPVGRKVKLVYVEEVRDFAENHSPPKPRLVDKIASME